MAYDSVILSPEYSGFGKREGSAVGVVIETGSFVEYVAGGIAPATAAADASMLSVENVSGAGDATYQYAVGENVHAQAVPSGCLVNLKMEAATYSAGDVIEVGAAGAGTALSSGVAVAVVPSFSGGTIGAGESLIVQLV